MKTCKRCGAENPEESGSCRECGAPLDETKEKSAGLLGSMGGKRYTKEEKAPTEEKKDAKPAADEPKLKKGTGLAGSMGGVRYSAVPDEKKPAADFGAEPDGAEKSGKTESSAPLRKEGTGLAGSMGGVRYAGTPKEPARPAPAAAPGIPPVVTPAPAADEPEKKRRVDRGTIVALISAALAVAAAVLVIFQGAIRGSTQIYGMGLGGYINYYTPVEEEQIREEEGIRYAGDQMVIVSALNLSYEEMESFFQEKDMKILGYVELIDTYQVELNKEYTLKELHQMAKDLERDTRVDSATVNAVRELESFSQPSDPWGNRTDWGRASWGSNNWGVMAIHAPACWDQYEPEQIKVGVIDSMFDEKQSDLRFAMAKDNEVFYNYRYKNDAAYGHGTHVSGIIGAIHDNNVGVSGVAENCEIYGYCAYDYLTCIDVVSAIAELAAQDVRVINYSMGYLEELSGAAMNDNNMEWDIYYNSASKFCETAMVHLLKKGYDFVLVCAAGNSPVDAKWTSVFTYITNPAVRSRILVVGAAGVDNQGNYYQATWSAIGPRVDVMAPGVGVYSTLPGGKYECWDGTSMAAPHVSGICASVWAIAPNLTGAEVKQIVLETATTPVINGSANLVDMEAAMAAASGR